MNKKYCLLVIAAALSAGCSSTKHSGSRNGEKEETFIPVEQVWPEVTQPQSHKATLQNKTVRHKTRQRRQQIPYANRRVVQVAADQPHIGSANINIQDGEVRGIRNITSVYGENHIIPVSLNFPTLFITSFAAPEIKGDFEKTPIDYEITGSNIIMIPQKKQRAWVMVYDKANPRGIPISLTLQPKPGLMSQTINLTVSRLSPSERSNGIEPGSGSFAQELASVLHEIARLRIPPGYSVRPLKEKIGMQNGMTTMPIEQYNNNRFDVYRYRITNSTGHVQQLAEEMFGRNKRVRAVAFYPKKILYPGEVTDVLIMTSKNGGMK